MPRRRFPRTPEGAWYRGYAGLKLPRSPHSDHGYWSADFQQPPPRPNDDRSHATAREPLSHHHHSNNNAYERETFLYDSSSLPRRPLLIASMDPYHEVGVGGGGSSSNNPGLPSYGRPPQRYPEARRRSWDVDRGRYPAHRGDDDDLRLYDGSFPTGPRNNNNGPMQLKLYDPEEFQRYSPRRGNDPPPPPLPLPPPAAPPLPAPPSDGKILYDLSPRRNGEFQLWEPSPRNGFQPSPRNGRPGEAKHHDAAVLIANGPAEREWEPAGRMSPRRVGPHYEPSFHEPGTSTRNAPPPPPLPPWEREERAYQRSPLQGRVVAEGQGRGLGEEPGQGRGEGRGQALDPLMSKVTSHPTMSSSWEVGSKQAGSVFVFIRFHEESLAVMGQRCQAARTRDLRGDFVGIADKVYDFGDMSGKNRSGYAVFQFPSLESAEVFYNRDRFLRQPDFPRLYGDTEIFAIDLHTDPGTVKLFRTFLLSEVTLNDGLGEASLECYRDRFKTPFSRLLLDHGALPYAAFCDRASRRTLKRRYFERNDLITLHLFRDLDHFEQVRRHPKYSDLRGVHNSLAREKCSLFTVRPEFCP